MQRRPRTTTARKQSRRLARARQQAWADRVGDPFRDYKIVAPWITTGLLCVILGWTVATSFSIPIPKAPEPLEIELVPLELTPDQLPQQQELSPNNRHQIVRTPLIRWRPKDCDHVIKYKSSPSGTGPVPAANEIKADGNWTRGGRQWYKAEQEAPTVQNRLASHGRHPHPQRPEQVLLDHHNCLWSALAHV